jgi:putative ABC transport system substrate-binding protein
MDRRKWVGAMGYGLIVASQTIRAQPAGRVYRIGYLRGGDAVALPKVFWEAMQEHGWVEGQNVRVESRFAPDVDQVAALAREFVRSKVDLIMTGGTQASEAAKQTTSAIPVVFAVGDDPVETGLVASLARPGGNLTGFVSGHYDQKLLEVLKEALPGVSRVAYPAVDGPRGLLPSGRLLDAAGLALGLKAEGIVVEGPGDFGRFYAVARRDGAQAVMIPNIVWFMAHLESIASEATRSLLPTIGFDRRFVEAGGLMSYGPKESERWIRLAAQVDKMLKGAKPSDQPVEQPAQFELLINAKVAKSLGITIARTVLLRADEVIQ